MYTWDVYKRGRFTKAILITGRDEYFKHPYGGNFFAYFGYLQEIYGFWYAARVSFYWMLSYTFGVMYLAHLLDNKIVLGFVSVFLLRFFFSWGRFTEGALRESVYLKSLGYTKQKTITTYTYAEALCDTQ